MDKYVSRDSIAEFADHFRGCDYRKPEQLGLFLYFKAVGLNEYIFSTYHRWGDTSQPDRKKLLRRMYDLSGVFDASAETGLKRTSLFPFSICYNYRPATFYNGATAFSGLGSRISDTLDNTLVSSFIQRGLEQSQIKLADGYLDILLERTQGRKIPLEAIAGWYYKFWKICMPDNGDDRMFQDICVLAFLLEFHISCNEFSRLFSYGDKKIGNADVPISGPELRAVLRFDNADCMPEVTGSPLRNGYMPLTKTLEREAVDLLIDLCGDGLTSERIRQILASQDAELQRQAAAPAEKTAEDHPDDTRDGLSGMEHSLRFETGITIPFERNRIVFGAPGTGKSHRLEEDRIALLTGTTGSYERVTFHPEYTYSQFVGAYKPVMDANGEIRYDFVPGPFMRVLVEALKSSRTDTPQPHLLLIEEINRAKAAAVFGEVFQLLDRSEAGCSEYEIHTTEDIKKHLISKLGEAPDSLKIPDNMLIWATMNSADQGVFPMDTAFKRRWNFEYIGIDDNDAGVGGVVTLGRGAHARPIQWNALRKAINEVLAVTFKINEDKLLGPYFLSKRFFAYGADGLMVDPQRFIEAFKSKVIMYLYDDAAKSKKHELFQGCDSSRYSSVCAAFDEKGIEIFGADFFDRYRAMEA